MAKCGARKRDGTTCRQPAMANGRCRMHGGKTPTGLALPQTKHGRYSKYIPDRLQARYETALGDAQLLELRHEVALIDARLADLLARVDTGEAGALWRRAQGLMRSYGQARRDGDDAAEGLLRELQEVLGRGVADALAWAEVHGVIEQRRKLVESERKRLVEQQQLITVERAMLLVGAISGIIQKHVTDTRQLAAIANDIRHVLARPAGGPAGDGGGADSDGG